MTAITMLCTLCGACPAASCACWTPSTAKSADNCPLTTGPPVYIIFLTEKYNGI